MKERLHNWSLLRCYPLGWSQSGNHAMHTTEPMTEETAIREVNRLGLIPGGQQLNDQAYCKVGADSYVLAQCYEPTGFPTYGMGTTR